MSNEVSFETEELLYEMNHQRKNAMSVALLAAKLDCSKREVMKRIERAKVELARIGSKTKILHTPTGSYYLYDSEEAAIHEQEKSALLWLFTT